jgi:hypothetical protein
MSLRVWRLCSYLVNEKDNKGGKRVYFYLSPGSPLSSLKDVYEMRVATLMSPTPFRSRRKSSAVRPSRQPAGNTSNRPEGQEHTGLPTPRANFTDVGENVK